jgi:hypothetical protein
MSASKNQLLAISLVALFAVTLGYIATKAPIEALTAMFGLSAAFAIFVMTPVNVLWTLMVTVFLIIGQLHYFANIQQAYWLPYLMIIPVAFRAVIAKKSGDFQFRKSHLSLVAILIILFSISFVLSAALNLTNFALTIVATKNYILPWFLSLFIFRLFSTAIELRAIWIFLLSIVCVQPIFVIPQNFIFAKMRGDDVGWDSVVGSFGGDMLGGGNSGAMAIYLVFGLLLALSLIRRDCISSRFFWTVVGCSLISIALAEVKVFFLLLPIGIALLFRTEFIKRPIYAIGVILATVILISGLGVVYSNNYSESIAGTDSAEGLIDYVFFAEGDPYFFNPITREVSRVGAILLWAQANAGDSFATYFGQGPYSSRESQTLGDGIAQMQHGFSLSTSAASSMLWEVGVIGVSLFAGILTSAGTLALSLSKKSIGFEAGALESTGVMLLLCVPLMFYNRDLIDTPAVQILIGFWIGYILLCNKIIHNKLIGSGG